MDLEQYTKDAIKTESQIEKVTVDPHLLASTLQILIAAGSILDQIKKNVFYGKPYNEGQIVIEFTNIVESLDGLREIALKGLTPQDTSYNPRIFHAIVGITTEAVELLEGMNSEDFDTVNFLEELGDLNWYEAIGIDAVNGSFVDVLNTNIAKLKARYSDKFTSDAAINRDVVKERLLLDEELDDNENSDGC